MVHEDSNEYLSVNEIPDIDLAFRVLYNVRFIYSLVRNNAKEMKDVDVKVICTAIVYGKKE